MARHDVSGCFSAWQGRRGKAALGTDVRAWQAWSGTQDADGRAWYGRLAKARRGEPGHGLAGAAGLDVAGHGTAGAVGLGESGLGWAGQARNVKLWHFVARLGRQGESWLDSARRDGAGTAWLARQGGTRLGRQDMSGQGTPGRAGKAWLGRTG
jgi:hypothetical protein